MNYQSAGEVLPKEVLELLQQYVNGEYLYVPKKDKKKCAWGEKSGSRSALNTRNQRIKSEHLGGKSVEQLSDQYYLSVKSIYRIVNIK